jgi:lactose/L-arabinose transport system ATP-binding protein
VNDVDPSDRGTAMVFQTYALYPHMTVRAEPGLRAAHERQPRRPRSSGGRRGRTHPALEPLLDRRPALSGGQRQRVAIGRAIVRQPEVFLFDEPLSNLDAELRVQMRIEIARLHSELGTTMIYVTHDQVEAMTLADRIVVLRAGRVEQVGAPLDLYDNPDNQFVAGFIGSPRMNFLAAESLGGGRLKLPNQGGAEIGLAAAQGLAAGQKAVLGIRPEHFAAAGQGNCDLHLAIDVAEHLGATSYLYANTKVGEPVVVQAAAVRSAHAGDRVAVSIPAARAYLFDPNGARRA